MFIILSNLSFVNTFSRNFLCCFPPFSDGFYNLAHDHPDCQPFFAKCFV
ncbi:hypothetical protein I656_00071 [Geobacillus sp. WSUCF1]|nr:hypothetical protein I656_00071 [Geobacillus sp. WSUCF1]GAJ60261.1 hypothetical protein B23_3499 [Geobacillus thermoleovorans B23]